MLVATQNNPNPPDRGQKRARDTLPEVTPTVTPVDEAMKMVSRTRTVDKDKFRGMLQAIHDNVITIPDDPTPLIAEYLQPDDDKKAKKWWKKYGQQAADLVQQCRPHVPQEESKHDLFLTPVADRDLAELEYNRSVRAQMRQLAIRASKGITDEQEAPPPQLHTYQTPRQDVKQFIRDVKASPTDPDFEIQNTVPRGYNPRFDRNDLLYTNKDFHGGEIEIVALSKNGKLVYMTWCDDRRQLLQDVRAGQTGNPHLDNLQDRDFQLEDIYPPQYYRPEDKYILLRILEEEIELRAHELRPPHGLNDFIHHAVHDTLTKTGSAEAANHRIHTRKYERELENLINSMWDSVREYETAVRRLPETVTKFLDSPPDRAERCATLLLGHLDRMKIKFERGITDDVKAKIDEIVDHKQRYHARVERNMVECNGEPDPALLREFQNLGTVETPTTHQGFSDLRNAVDRFGGAYEQAKKWGALGDIRWCIALRDMDMWDPFEAPPPLSTEVTKKQINAKFRKLSRAHHPDRGGGQDRQAVVNAAKEYLLEKL